MILVKLVLLKFFLLKTMNFYGRKAELQQLSDFLLHSPDSLAVVYGRRRVGKSELLRKAVRDSGLHCVFYECRQTRESLNLATLSDAIRIQSGLPMRTPSSLDEVLEYLFAAAEKEPLVLVLDEYPYLQSLIKGADSILQAMIDRHSNRSKLKIILCGSYVDIMTAMLDYASPLYGRSGLVLHLKPMDYLEASAFYPEFSNEDKVRLYAVFGGIPAYTRKIDSALTVKENILKLVGTKESELSLAINYFLVSEVSKINNANSVFAFLSQSDLKFSDLLAKTEISSGAALSYTLAKLSAMGLVEKRAPINDEQNKRRVLYRISDPLTRYYYRYVERNQDSIMVMGPEAAFEHFAAAEFESQFVPKAFEEICRQFLIRLNKAGKIVPPFFKIGRYYYDLPKEKRNGEFDVVTQDNLGYTAYEIKFRSRPLTQTDIDHEMQQFADSPLPFNRYGFISRSGFDGAEANEFLRLFTMDDVYGLEC